MMRSGANVTTQFPAEGGGGGTDDRALESKVHEFAADFRRQRDEAHRGKELSAERLRLTKEEVGAANKSLQALKNKLSELKKASGTAATQEIQQLQNEVDSLTSNQVNFQHNELLGMREQLQRRQEKHANDESRRTSTITKLQELIVPRREYVAKCMEEATKPAFINPTTTTTTTTSATTTTTLYTEQLEEELQIDMDNNMYKKWPSMVSYKADSIERTTNDMAMEVELLQRIIAGYQRQWGFEIEEEEEKVEQVDADDAIEQHPPPESEQEEEVVETEKQVDADAAAAAAVGAEDSATDNSPPPPPKTTAGNATEEEEAAYQASSTTSNSNN